MKARLIYYLTTLIYFQTLILEYIIIALQFVPKYSFLSSLLSFSSGGQINSLKLKKVCKLFSFERKFNANML